MGSGSGKDTNRVRRAGRETPVARSRVCVLTVERERTERLLSEEAAARAAGFRRVAGVDEAGRGCLAGPVFAGAVILGERPLLGLDDSKVLLPEVRAELDGRIRRCSVGFAVGAATPAEIDVLGIAQAAFLAMRRALEALARMGTPPDLVLVDAFRIPGLVVEQRPSVRADARIACVAAASIVAKTARDLFMEGLDLELPHFGFRHHHGYGTAEHRAALRRHGPSPAHRLSFDGVLPSAPSAPPPRSPRAAPDSPPRQRAASAA